ncbi:MAG: hypothetical protein WBG58_01875 [Ignavibacteriaceae bacterium]
MIKTIRTIVLLVMIFGLFGTGCLDAQDDSFRSDFNLSERTLVSTGRNEYFILEPGYQLILEDRFTKLTITVLDETKKVNGIITRVVEEKEWIRGNIYEVSRNFFAIDKETNDVFYFGEEVDFYRDGKVTDHYGAWLAGEDGAMAGLIMPGEISLGMKYYQELAPNVAMDRAEIISINDNLDTPAGTFSKCLTTKEGTALNFREVEFKTYAPVIGLIQDQSLLLTKHGFLDK